MPTDRLTDDHISRDDMHLTLADLWNTICRRKGFIFLSTLLVVILAAIYIALAPRKYEASSVIMIQNEEQDLGMQKLEAQSPVNALSQIPTEIQILTSRELINGVISNIASEAEELGKPAPALSVNGILANLDVEQVGRSLAIDITYTSKNPELAANIANQVAKAYIALQQQWTFATLNETNSWLKSRVKAIQKEISETQKEIVAYKEATGLVDSRGTDLIEQDVSGLSQRLTAAKAELAEVDAKLQQFNSGNIASSPAVLQSSLIQALRVREAASQDELAQLLEELGPGHPDYIAARQRVLEVRKQIGNEIAKIRESTQRERRVAAAKVARLEKTMESFRDEYASSKTASIDLEELENDLKTNLQLLDMLNLRLKQTQSQIDEQLQEATAVILSKAVVPDLPSHPKIPLILIGSIIAGIGLGLAFAIGQDQLEGTVFNGKQLQKITRITNITLVPETLLRRKDKVTHLSEYPVKDPYCLYTESMRAISSYLMINKEDNPDARVFNFTSVLSGEGKSTVVSSLARHMAQEDMKVAVIDCDLRQQVLTSIFGLKGKPGLADLLEGSAGLKSVVNRDDLSGAYVIGCGAGKKMNITSITKDKWLKLRDVMLKEFDVILLDGPPLLSVSDTKILAASTENILCVRWKHTKVKQIQFILDTLNNLNCRLLGTVITRVNIKKSSAYNTIDYKYYNRPTKERT